MYVRQAWSREDERLAAQERLLDQVSRLPQVGILLVREVIPGSR
jgi:hypothetical protein